MSAHLNRSYLFREALTSQGWRPFVKIKLDDHLHAARAHEETVHEEPDPAVLASRAVYIDFLIVY